MAIDSIHGAPLPMIDLEAFVPDVMAECPAAPVPVIERRLREAITEACERANLVRWQAPELATNVEKVCYDVPVPNVHTQVHSIVRAYLNRCAIPNIPPIETLDNVYNPLPNYGRGYFVPNRGQLQLTHPPGHNSDPFELGSTFDILTICDPDVTAAEILTACGVLPVDPGPIAAAIPATYDTDPADIYNYSLNHPTFSIGDTRAFHGGGAAGSNAAVIEEAARDRDSGVYYWETELDSYSNPSTNNGTLAGITQEVPVADFVHGGVTQSIAVAANNGSNAVKDVFQGGSVIYTRTGAEIIQGSVVRHILDLDARTYSVAVDGGPVEEVANSLAAGAWWPFTQQSRSSAGLIGAAWTMRTVSTQFTETVPAGALSFGTEEVTQGTIDQYNLDIAAYNSCVTGLNACLVDPSPFTGVDPGPVDPGNPATFDTAVAPQGALSNIDFTNNDLTATINTASAFRVVMQMQPNGTPPDQLNDLTSGKHAWAVRLDTVNTSFVGMQIGIGDNDQAFAGGLGFNDFSACWNTVTGDIFYRASGATQTVSVGVIPTNGQTVVCLMDLDLMTMEWLLDGVSIHVLDLNLLDPNPADWSPLIDMTGNATMTSVTMQFDEADIVASLGTALPAGYTTFGTPAVTQQQVDDYAAALAQFNLDLAAYNAQQAEIAAAQTLAITPRALFGLELFVTLKPTRECDYVAKVLYDDYYNLVISGALSKLLKMHEVPWQDHAYATQKEIEFEHEIARAKQQIDRGFTTKPNKIRPRRFV